MGTLRKLAVEALTPMMAKYTSTDLGYQST